MKKKRYCFLPAVLFLLLWTLFTLYPQPSKLAVSLYRLFHLPVNSSLEEVQYLAVETLDNCPAAIRSFVLDSFPYHYDWEVYRLPWYFPTAKEAFANGRGDCKTRAVVTASLLEAKEEAYTVRASPTHIWVEHEKKPPSPIEREEQVLIAFEEDVSFRLPSVDWARSWRLFREAFWEHMPYDKKMSLGGGLVAFLMIALTPTETVLLRFKKDS